MVSKQATPAALSTSNVELVREFVTGGRATFTVVSKKTQARYTYKVKAAPVRRRRKWETEEQYVARKAATLAGPKKVLAMTGQDNTTDYTEIGTLTPEGEFKAKARAFSSRLQGRVQGFAWFAKALKGESNLEQAEVWHSGHCACCGKTLTVPESLSTGIGPICASHRYNPEGIRTHLGK